LAGGPAGGALVAGNTVVLKPSHQGYFTALKLWEALTEGGVPKQAFHIVTGPGSTVGDELYNNPEVDGLTFTGSYAVGMEIYHHFAKDYPKPAICEMGGKNPTIVTAKADLDKATDGVMRSAFGFGGQKCSACSRVYVERPAYDGFVQKLLEKTAMLQVGNPLRRGVLLRGQGGAAAVPRRDPGGRRLREPTGRRHDRGLAGHAAVRRLEGVRHERQGRRRSALRAAVPPGAEPDRHRGLRRGHRS